MRRCACHGRRFCVWALVQSAAFPVEHFAWERLWPLTFVTKALGL